jgi:murein DD-endopeptidase MepM/ murein hydrolase activator NlpD
MIKIFFKKSTLHKPFLFFISLTFSSLSFAQFFPAKNYPKGYFIYPVEARIGLAANFGELRANHYHMGLDCRTDRAENKIVKAAAEGYIARVSVAPFGFGRAIYINHPNGLTTLYGHLNEFYPALEKYVKEQQYKLESWQVSLIIPAGLFPVKKGQFIAYSGNTGGSQGPHCHFEIRDTKTEKVLNPLLFNLPIPDNVPPTILRLSMYDRCKSTYSQVPKIFALKTENGKYTTVQNLITVNTDKISQTVFMKRLFISMDYRFLHSSWIVSATMKLGTSMPISITKPELPAVLIMSTCRACPVIRKVFIKISMVMV